MDKIRFSIGAKLITIISIIVVFSLGSITVLVSWLVQTDLRITAEENNFEINRRSALETESTLTNIRSSSRVLIQTITSILSRAAESQGNVIKESTDFFFNENPQVAVVFFAANGEERLLINSRFFASKTLDEELGSSYFNTERASLARAVRGETLLRNAAPHFNRPVLAMFFPWQNSGVGGVLFSSDSLNSNLGFGLNQSYMLNSDCDVLVHADFSLVKDGTNIASLDFVSDIYKSPDRSRQHLLKTDFGVHQYAVNEIDKGIVTFIWGKIKPVAQPVVNKISSLFSKLLSKINIKPKEKIDDGKVLQFVAFTKLNTAGAVVITSIEYDKVFEGIAATTRRNIYLTVAVLCISIIFIWFFSKTISIPLRTLAAAAREIEGGKFNFDSQSKRHDEIGVLNNSFNKMCSALNIFGRFTNKDIAVKAMRGVIKPGGLPKHATIFFSDIRDFTAKSEQITREFGSAASDKIVYWLNNYFTQMIECVEKTNGAVDKFIGDAVMAHWGTVSTDGNPRKDAFNCVKAALMMRKELYYMNAKRSKNDLSDPPICIGCGINSGIVTAGQLGSDMRMEYTVIGDPVNLASRIEALTKPLHVDILISEDTWKLVGDKFITEEMPSVTVKGKEKPVRIFAVVNFYGEPKGPQSLDEVRTLLGLDPPDLEKIDVNADEVKYHIAKDAELA